MGSRILLIGSDRRGSLENYYLDHIKSMPGITVDLFPAQTIFYNYYFQSVKNKILFKIGISGIYNIINQKILDEVEAFKPDFILIFKGMEIFPSTLDILKEKKIKLINYNPDHPFEFYSAGSGNKNVKNSIPKYDLYITYSNQIQISFVNKYPVRCEVLPFGYEFLCNSIVTGDEELRRVCFIGNPDRNRARNINMLAENNLKIDVFGNKWSKWINSSPNIQVFGPIYQDDFVKRTSKYRLSLNMFRPHNFDSHNMRSFEIPAAGSILLTPYSTEQNTFFENGKEIFFFSSDQELIEQTKKILDLSVEVAYNIKAYAIKKSIEFEYSYYNRAISLIKFINSL